MSLSQYNQSLRYVTTTYEGADVEIGGSGAAARHVTGFNPTAHGSKVLRSAGNSNHITLPAGNPPQVVSVSAGVYVPTAGKKVRLSIRRYIDAVAPAEVPGAFAVGQSAGLITIDAQRILMKPGEKIELFIENVSDAANLSVAYVRFDATSLDE